MDFLANLSMGFGVALTPFNIAQALVRDLLDRKCAGRARRLQA